MIILDQHPSQISMPALGNTYCTICFNLKHRTDVSAMSQAMLLQDDEKNLLGELQVGQAIVRLQGRSVKPFMISVPEFNITKGAFTDTRVMRHMTQLGLLSVRRQPVQRVPAPGRQDTAAVASPEIEATGRTVDDQFLIDVQTYPESGIAERYKRLGLSVRQGQKVKLRLIAAAIVEEQLQTTHSGKLRVIRLTEKGRLVVENRVEQMAGEESAKFTRQDNDDALTTASPTADLADGSN
jgi:hypothetical protein